MQTEAPRFKIAAFYRFIRIERGRLEELRDELRGQMIAAELKGTIILAEEGINTSICGTEAGVSRFIEVISSTLDCRIEPKYSYSSECPFRKVDVKVKSEIVTLRERVDIALGVGTHVSPSRWNELIEDPDVIVLDTRNDYEFKTGTFINAINPVTEKFSELPKYVSENLDPAKHKKVAMFCTGGIRCEKFAPYMRSLGFENVFQLEGGILKYLEEVPVEQQKWTGECYVFDTRVSVNNRLDPGRSDDLSQSEA